MVKSDWINGTVEAIRLVAEIKRRLTTDDIWPYVKYPPERRWMGDAMRKAGSLGYITHTDRSIKSKRPECNKRPVFIWTSNIYELLPTS